MFLNEIVATLAVAYRQLKLGDPQASPPTGNIMPDQIAMFERFAILTVQAWAGVSSLSEETLRALEPGIVKFAVGEILFTVIPSPEAKSLGQLYKEDARAFVEAWLSSNSSQTRRDKSFRPRSLYEDRSDPWPPDIFSDL